MIRNQIVLHANQTIRRLSLKSKEEKNKERIKRCYFQAKETRRLTGTCRRGSPAPARPASAPFPASCPSWPRRPSAGELGFLGGRWDQPLRGSKRGKLVPLAFREYPGAGTARGGDAAAGGAAGSGGSSSGGGGGDGARESGGVVWFEIFVFSISIQRSLLRTSVHSTVLLLFFNLTAKSLACTAQSKLTIVNDSFLLCKCSGRKFLIYY